MIERIDISERMSKIVKHNGVAYLCGQVGSGESATEQTLDCLARIDALLEKAGSSRSQILQTVIWLSDMKYFKEMNAVWDSGSVRLTSPSISIHLTAMSTRSLKNATR